MNAHEERKIIITIDQEYFHKEHAAQLKRKFIKDGK